MPYCLIRPAEIVCADSSQSQYDKKGNVQEFVLDVEKTEGRKIFMAKDFNREVVVRLDIAEVFCGERLMEFGSSQ